VWSWLGENGCREDSCRCVGAHLFHALGIRQRWRVGCDGANYGDWSISEALDRVVLVVDLDDHLLLSSSCRLRTLAPVVFSLTYMTAGTAITQGFRAGGSSQLVGGGGVNETNAGTQVQTGHLTVIVFNL